MSDHSRGSDRPADTETSADMLNRDLTPEQLVTRQRHATDKLTRPGVLEGSKQWSAVRLIMWLVPRATPPQYGDRLFWTLAVTALFWLFLACIPALMVIPDPWMVPFGIAGTLAIALLFGWLWTKATCGAAQAIGVTQWEQLDEPPPEDVSEAVEAYRRIPATMERVGRAA